jgi:hypothetical protein
MQDDGEGLAFDTDSCATMKLSNHMVLYLKEVWRLGRSCASLPTLSLGRAAPLIAVQCIAVRRPLWPTVLSAVVHTKTRPIE